MENITVLNFKSDFFFENFKSLVDKEIPFLIRNINFLNYQEISLRDLTKNIEKKGTKEFGWYVRELDLPQFKPPCFINDLIESGHYFVSNKPFRTFMQPEGHHTLAHYDGNSLHGFNLQVRGRKHWRLVSPTKSLRMVPFMYIVMEQNQVNRNVDFEFETLPGDLLFLPRYWIHDVSTKENVNLNFNWVLTPKQPKLDCYNGNREAQIIKLRKTIPLINKFFFPDNFENYGGGGDLAIQNYIKEVSLLSSLYRLCREIFNYLALPFYYLKVNKMAKEFKVNNFKIQDEF